MYAKACGSGNQAPRSTSANCTKRFDRGGHSISKALLRSSVGSQSPSKAQAETCLPPACLIVPTAWNGPRGTKPVSSSNSRRAAASSASPSVGSPLGIVQAPLSFCAQYGPPGCTNRTSSSPARHRYMTSPALSFGMACWMTSTSTLVHPTSDHRLPKRQDEGKDDGQNDDKQRPPLIQPILCPTRCTHPIRLPLAKHTSSVLTQPHLC